MRAKVDKISLTMGRKIVWVRQNLSVRRPSDCGGCRGIALAHSLTQESLIGKGKRGKKNFIESNTLKFFLRGNLFFDHITLDIISKSMFIGRIDSWI